MLAAFALMLVVLFGFAALVVDAGAVYVAKQRAQQGADAGALAGAQALLTGADVAVDTAVAMARRNDALADYTATADAGAGRVRVTGRIRVPLWFARIFGEEQVSIVVEASAVLAPLERGTGMVPLAVPQQTFTYGQRVYLTDDAGDGQSGNYGFLDFSGRGARGLEADLAEGYPFPLWVGEQVPTEPGRMTGPVAQAIDLRMAADADDASCASFETVRSDCHRVMYLPVVDSLDVDGKKPITIVGFAAFWLEGLVDDGGHQRIAGRFLRLIRPGEAGPAVFDDGVYTVRLTE